MAVYFIVFFLTLILQGIVKSNSPKAYKKRIIITLLPLFLFGALRVGEGDYMTYKNTFDFIHMTSDLSNVNDHYEKGFVLLCKFLPSFRLLIILVSFMMCLGYGTLIYRYVPQEYLWLAVVLIFLSANNSVYFILQTMRNGLAVSLLMLAIPLIRRNAKSLLLYSLIGFIAWSLHTSALFAFIIALIVGIKTTSFSKKELIVWSGVFAFFFFSSASGLLTIIEPIVGTHFDRYDSVIRELNKVTGHSATLMNLGAIILTIPVLLFLRNIKLDFDKLKLFRLFLLYCLSFFLGVLNTRVTQYFCPYMFMAVPIMVRYGKTMEMQIYVSFIVGFISYAMYLWTHSEWFTHLVYHSILD